MLNINENIVLAQYTVFKIGGASDYFCIVKNKEELIEALDWANKKSLPFFILGAGSNVLVSDDGFRGLVIKINLQGINVVPTQGRDGFNRIAVESGVSMARTVNFAIEHGIGGGFEWGVGVPGSIGGSIFGNAGCYGNEMKDVVESVTVLSLAHSDFLALNPLSGGSDTHPKSERASALQAQVFQDFSQRDGARLSNSSADEYAGLGCWCASEARFHCFNDGDNFISNFTCSYNCDKSDRFFDSR